MGKKPTLLALLHKLPQLSCYIIHLIKTITRHVFKHMIQLVY